MFEHIAEKQCGRCMKCKSTIEFRFRCRTMAYYAICRQCECEVKAAKRTPKPRASKWSEAERAIVRTYYPEGGLEACQPLLPHHNANAIRGIANKMELKYVGPRRQGCRPLDDSDVPLPAPWDYTDADRAWMATRLPVFVGGFGAAVIGRVSA
jgi:hypothetical protein